MATVIAVRSIFETSDTYKGPADSGAARYLGRDTAEVRKQYHFWPGEHGLDAWDLDRLIELSNGLPVKDVDLASIEEIDSVYWTMTGSSARQFGEWWTTLV